MARETMKICAAMGIILLWAEIAFADSCAPTCDWTHNYGPYDLSWVYPGLVGIPVCDRDGYCLPQLVYRYTGSKPGITITVRPTHGVKQRLEPHRAR